MSLNLKSRANRNKLAISLIGFFISQIFCLYLIRRIFATFKSDVLGTPLLSIDGHLTLELSIFVAIQLILIPSWTVIILNSNSGLIDIAISRISRTYKSLRQEPQTIYRGLITIGYIFYIFVVFITTNLASIRSNFKQIALTLAVLTPFILSFLLYLLKKSKLQISNVSKSQVVTLTFSSLFGLTFFIKFSHEPGVLKLLFLIWPVAFFILSKVLIRCLRGLRSSSTLERISADLFLYVPGFVFLLYSKRVAHITLNPFEDFPLSNARLLGKGYLPWKDFSVEHGLWEDLLRPYLGGILINHSDWGSIAGIQGFIRPAEYTILGICVYLLARNLSTTIIIISINNLCERVLNISTLEIPRMIPLMVLTVILKYYLEKRSYIFLVSLSFISGIAILWAPEGVYPVTAVILVFISLTIINYPSINNNLKSFSLYLLILCATVIIPLVLTGLIVPWLQSTLSNSDGYFFAWGSDFQFSLGFTYGLLTFLVPIICLGAMSMLAVNMFRSKYQHKMKFVWTYPVFFTCFAYYVKFLQWPDWHLKQSVSLLLFAIICIIATVESTRSNAPFLSHLPLAIILLVSSTTSAGNEAILEKPKILMQTAGHSSQLTEAYIRRIAAVEKSFRPFLKNESDVKILDFGNEPVTWFDLLDYEPAGADIKMLSLASSRSQKKAIENYNLNLPDAVIWGGEFGYWKGPINGTWMKQYLLSAFIIDNFAPVATNGEYVLLLNRRDHVANEEAKLKMMSLDCNWLQGAERFLPPTETTRGELLTPVKFKESMQSNQSSEVFRMSKSFSAKGLYISSEAGNFKLQNVSGGGSIKFTFSKPVENQLIWLDNCPAFRYSDDQSYWSLSSDLQSLPNSSLRLALGND